MDISETVPDWRIWCRLCAKDDIQGNIDVFVKDEQDLNVSATVEHLFGVCIRQTEDLPHMLCTECFSLLTTLAIFTERVAKAQEMFHTLQEFDADGTSGELDLHAVRTKFGMLDEDREHLMFVQPITEVHCYEAKPRLVEHEAESQNQQRMKLRIKKENMLDDGMLGDEKDERHNDYVVEEEEEEEQEVAEEYQDANAEDPFHGDEVDCMADIADVLNDDDDLLANVREQNKSSADEMETAIVSVTKTYRNKDGIRKTRQRRKRRHSNADDNKVNHENHDNNVPCNSETDGEADEVKLQRKRMSSSKTEREAENIYQCSECPRKFKRVQHFRQHMKRTHSKCAQLPELRCEECQRIFNTQYQLERHAKIHLPLELKKVLPCPYCEKKFSTNTLVQTHIKCIHMNERPFICEECGVAVRTNSSLKTHMLTHTDSAPFICDICNKGFKDQTRLKNHKEIHDPNKHICAECGLQLNSRSTLNRHLLVHSDEMKHKCDYCGRAFKRGKALKNHLILHTGLKPYSCDFCERTFANGSNCRSHKKKAHPEELAALEAAGGGKTYTRNIPKLEALKAVTKAADNLTPVVTKQSGRFAFGKKPKTTPTKEDSDKQPSSKSNKSVNAQIASNTATANANKNTPTSIPTIDNIYSHILKHANTAAACNNETVTTLPLGIKRSPDHTSPGCLTLEHETDSATSHIALEMSASNLPLLQQQQQQHFYNPSTTPQHHTLIVNSPSSQGSGTHLSVTTATGNGSRGGGGGGGGSNNNTNSSNAEDDQSNGNATHFYNQIRQNMSSSYM